MSQQSDFERTVTNYLERQEQSLSIYYSGKDAAAFMSQEFNKIIEASYKTANQIVVSQEYLANQMNKSIENVKEAITEGFASVQATFEWGLAEIVWTLEQQKDILLDILEVLQNPLDTQAKELKRRGEEAFRYGWFDDAERDFLESEKKNPYDFTIHWYLGYIYLFHKTNPILALRYFKNAVKYSSPKSTYYAANALRHVALVYYFQKELEQAYITTQQAIHLHPTLYESYYQHAQYCSCLGKYDEAIECLKTAVTKGNRLYLLKVDAEKDFDIMRGKIETLEIELRDNTSREIKTLFKPLQELYQIFKSEYLPIIDNPYGSGTAFEYFYRKEKIKQHKEKYEQLLNLFSEIETSIKKESYFDNLDTLPKLKEFRKETSVLLSSDIEYVIKSINEINESFDKEGRIFRYRYQWAQHSRYRELDHLKSLEERINRIFPNSI
jgi:predicted HTH domain antitoxin